MSDDLATRIETHERNLNNGFLITGKISRDLQSAAARIRELEAELSTLRDWDDHFRAVCGFKRDGRPSPECLDEYLAALSSAPVSVGEAAKVLQTALMERDKTFRTMANAAFKHLNASDSRVSVSQIVDALDAVFRALSETEKD